MDYVPTHQELSKENHELRVTLRALIERIASLEATSAGDSIDQDLPDKSPGCAVRYCSAAHEPGGPFCALHDSPEHRRVIAQQWGKEPWRFACDHPCEVCDDYDEPGFHDTEWVCFSCHRRETLESERRAHDAGRDQGVRWAHEELNRVLDGDRKRVGIQEGKEADGNQSVGRPHGARAGFDSPPDL